VTNPTKFWDRVAEGYARKPIADEAAYREKLRITREYLRPDMNVLELGCGTGSTAIEHAPHVRHVRAVDISPKMLDIARGRAAAANVDNVDFDVADVDTLDPGEEAVDAVLALSLLHLLEDRDAAIARVFALLEPGGIFVSNTVCLGDRLGFFRFLGPIGRWFGLIPYLAVFTVRDLEESLVRGGFVIDESWQPPRSHAVFIVATKPG